MSTAEEWRPVRGYEGFYSVSSYGRVQSLDRFCLGRDGRSELHHGKILKPWRGKNGYLYVSIKRRHATVHRLVADAFIGPAPDKHDVMHINGNREDNRIENLQYGTRSENLRSTYDYGGRQANGKLNLLDVDVIRTRLAAGENPQTIAEDFKVNSAAIYHIQNGTTFSWYKGGRPANAARETCFA